MSERVDAEVRTWDVVQIVHEYGPDHDYYFFGGKSMYASAPPLRLFAKKYRLVSGVSSVDIPYLLERDTIFIIPSFLPANEHRLRHIGSVITERFPESRRSVIGNSDEPEFVLYEAPAIEPSSL